MQGKCLLNRAAWLRRYERRTQHPSGDAEKVTVENGVVTRIHRTISEGDAYGEYIGVARFSAAGAALLREHYHRRRREFAGLPWREAKVFEKAYLIHLLQEMIECGTPMAHVDTPGGYIEVDTQEDFEYARRFWQSRHLEKQAMKYIAADRITLNPDCGFAPGSGADVNIDEVYVKLQNEVEAARRLREKYA